MEILALPDEILDKILSYSTFDEVSRLRLVCKKFDASAQRILNQGFYRAEKFHRDCMRKVKEQLPRRESERRKHPLSVHCDILTAIDNRLSLLGMTFMKYVELKYCCFIPGKVLDEIFRILRFVSNLSSSPRAHVILQELRDISSMAMDHFDEHIAPAFKARSKSSQQLTVSSYGVLEGNYTSYESSLATPQGELGILRLYASIKQNNSKILELKKDTLEMKRKNVGSRRKLNELNRRVSEMENTISEQMCRITNLENKSLELSQKFSRHERVISEVQELLQHIKARESACQSTAGRSASPDIEILSVSSADAVDLADCLTPPSKKQKLSGSPVKKRKR